MKNATIEKVKCGQHTSEIMQLCKAVGFASYRETGNILSYRWDYGGAGIGDDIGYILKDGDKITGFLGCIYANRNINGRKFVQCNFTTMVVLPEYRFFSLNLLNACSDDAEVVLDLTPAPNVREILLSKQFGFQPLEQVRFCFNLTKFKQVEKAEATTDIFAMLGRVDEITEADILNNARYGVAKFLMTDFSGKTLVLGYRISYKNRLFRTAEVLSVSDRDLFAQHFEQTGCCLRKADGAYFMHIDQRYLPNEFGYKNNTSSIGKLSQLIQKCTITEHYGAVYHANCDIDPTLPDALYTERVLTV